MLEIAPRSERSMMYNEAILYCQFCNHNGYTDWRLPTEDEWGTINEIVWDVWYQDESSLFQYRSMLQDWRVIPVRDVTK